MGTSVSKTAAHTLDDSDFLVKGNCTAGAFTLTLPAASSVNTGHTYFIKKTDTTANALTVSGNIDGSATTRTLKAHGQSLVLANDGSTWRVQTHRSPSQLFGRVVPTHTTGETVYWNAFVTSVSATESSHSVKTLRPFAITGFSIRPATNGLAAGESVVFTLRKNGADTGITLTITDATTTTTYVDSTAAPVEYAAGDTFNLKLVASALGANRAMAYQLALEYVNL